MPGTSAIRLTARDRHLLSELQRLRIVDREQAQLFAPFTSTTRANARLLALTNARLLQRIFVGTINGGRKALYTLPGRGTAGVWRRGNQLDREHAFAHQLAVNRLYYYFKGATQPQPDLRLLDWHVPTRPLRPDVPLIPDAIARLVRANGEIIQTFIELDLGTEPLRTWERKAERYLAFALSHKPEVDVRSRILVIAPAEQRRQTISGAIGRVTTNLFWLATATDVEQRGPWAPIWKRPSATDLQTLI